MIVRDNKHQVGTVIRLVGENNVEVKYFNGKVALLRRNQVELLKTENEVLNNALSGLIDKYEAMRIESNSNVAVAVNSVIDLVVNDLNKMI